MPLLRLICGIALLAAIGWLGLVLARAGLEAGAEAGVPGGGPAGGRAEGIPVQVSPVTAMRFADRVQAVGSTEALRSVEIYPLASGRVEEIGFVAGQQVAAGDVLMRLDDDAERATLDFARATLAEAGAALERARRLGSRNVTSEAAREASEAAMLRAEAEVALAEAALDQRVIRAPFAGVLGRTEAQVGSRVDPATPIVALDDLSRIEIAFAIPERHRAAVAPGQPIEARSPAFPERAFAGRVSEIATRVEADTRSVALRARIPNDGAALVPGMFMNVALLLNARSTPAVPEAAVAVEGPRAFVMVAAEGTIERREVRTGASQEDRIEIVAGLAPGEAVAVSNLHRLEDGSAVEILPAPDAAVPAMQDPASQGPAAPEGAP